MSSMEEVQFPRQVEDEQPQESLMGEEPQVEEQQHVVDHPDQPNIHRTA